MMMGTLSIVSGIYAQEKKFHSVLVASYFATGPLIYALTSTFQAIERISAYIEYCTETEHKNLKKLIKPLQNVRTAIFGLLSTLTTGGAVYGIVTKKDPLPIDILSIAGAIDTIGIAGLLYKIDNLSASNSYDEKKRQQYINQLSNMTNGLFINLGLLNGAGGIYGLADAKDPVLSSISLVNGIITGIIAGKFIQLDKQRKAKQVEIIEA